MLPSARSAFLAALLITLATATAVVVLQPAQPAAGAAARVMPLGDSITGSPGCWRALLWQRLQSEGHTNVDFVGTLPPQGCGVAHDGDNEGHGGILATNMANQNLLPTWLSATRPDIVVMHLGTNDVWSNVAAPTILSAFSTLVDQMRASNPSMKILVAKIIPMAPASCPACGQRVTDLNNAIPGWAAGKTTTSSPITVVDQWTGFSTATDTYDGVHPDASGDQKMADRWYQPLVAALSGTSPSPSASTSPSPSTTVSPTAAPQKRCAATYRLVNQWQGGFQGEITVTNTDTVAITGWTVVIVFGDGRVVIQLWGGSHTQSGNTVTIRNAPWNGNLGPGGSANVGFLGTWDGGNNSPVSITCTPS